MSTIQLVIEAVDKATAPIRGVASALGGLAKGVGFGLAAGAGMELFSTLTSLASRLASMPGDIISVGAATENLRISLTAITGSAANAEKALEWIEQFTARTQLEMAETTKMFMFLKNAGIDPTAGSMQYLVDIGAKYGIGGASLSEITRQWGQAMMKGKLQMEEMNVLTERGVPILDALGKALGKTTAEIMEMSEKGTIGPKQMEAALRSLGTSAAGASDMASKGWSGMMSTLSDTWAIFQRRIADAGFFDAVKARLTSLMETIGQMEASGALKRLAEDIGQTLTQGVAIAEQAILRFWGILRQWADPAGQATNAAQVLGMALQKLGAELLPIGQAIVGTVAALASFANGVREVASAFSFLMPVGSAFNQINLALLEVWKLIGTLLVTTLGPAFRAIGDTISSVTATISAFIDKLNSMFSIGERVGQFGGMVSRAFSGAADAARNFIGVSRAAQSAPVAAQGVAGAPAVPNAAATAAKAGQAMQQTNVGGQVSVKVEAVPGTKAVVQDVKSINKKIPLTVDQGLSMGVP